jgi:hypothetical protein
MSVEGTGTHQLGFWRVPIMLVVQICILIKVGIKNGHLDLHNLVYPVAKLGAAKQLEHIDVEERPYVQSLILRETGLEKFGTYAAKGCLCKTSENRVVTIYDVVFPGQCLFCICTTTGCCLVRIYGSHEWEPVNY